MVEQLASATSRSAALIWDVGNRLSPRNQVLMESVNYSDYFIYDHEISMRESDLMVGLHYVIQLDSSRGGL